MSRVLFQANWCPQYRYPFYNGLRTELARRGVTLDLTYGAPPRKFRARGDHRAMDWARPRRQWMPGIGSVEIQFDPIHARRSYDLLIIEIIAKQISTYAQLSLAGLGLGPPVGFFGHGAVDRTPSTKVARLIKRRLASSGEGWLVYTEQGKEALVGYGVDRERVHVLNNTIDASDLRERVSDAHDDGAKIRNDLGLGNGPVLLHIGGLDDSKRLDLVLDSFRLIKRDFPAAELIVAGDGAGAAMVVEAATRESGIHYLGPVFGSRRAELFAVSSLLLHPGKVGLVVIDSFASGVPLVVARGQLQAPEFDYLRTDVAQFAPRPNAASVAEAAGQLLGDEALLSALSSRVEAEYEKYLMPDMVDRACHGIESMLAGT